MDAPKQILIRSQSRVPTISADKLSDYPVLPLMTGVLFPGMTFSIQVGRPENVKLIETCQQSGGRFVSSYSRAEVETSGPQPIHQVGVFTEVRSVQAGAGGSLLVTIEGISRAILKDVVATEPYIIALAAEAETAPFVSRIIRARMDEVIAVVNELTHLDPTYSPELSNVIKMNVEDPSLFADRVAAAFHFSLASKQELLEALNLDFRFERLLYYLNGELDRVVTVLSVNRNTKQRIQDEQRKYYLRQQLHEIRRQLGEDFSEEKEAARLRNMIKSSSHLPPEVVARAKIEVDRLSQLSPASAEYGATKSYLDWILNLPWGKSTSHDFQMADVEKVLSSDYFGPVVLKEQIMQKLAVRRLAAGDEGPTLCLVGAPGTGKASMAKAIARALGKEFVRISVGGITEVAELKGSPRTYLGSYPGKIIRTLREIGTCDAVVLIEDLDYFNIDNNSSVNMALLEVIDSRRNARFLDNYLGVPFDLSQLMFICSVRTFEEIPEQFVPRLELVELPGYIEKEKIVIAKRYIIPNLLKKHGIARHEFNISDKVLAKIINDYTQEAGLLGFSQQMEKICRKIDLAKPEKPKSKWLITEKNLESFLGTSVFIPEKAELKPEVGISAGLAWTGAGGELMFIEGLRMKGEGQIITTGSLGEVMRESIQAAHSYVRSKSDMLGIDANDFREFDIHIHFPSGAIPKDGPSAGITVCLVIASVMSDRPIRNDIAMTGEVTLRGKVLPVGGVKEKVSAAYRAGIKTVVLPKENQKDIKDLPRDILRHTEFHYIERVDELFKLCLQKPVPTTHSLKRIFVDEIKKARRRKNHKRKYSRAARSRR
ncbi:MAG: endopeptidase La [candidate division Zixibacteria bacterium]|nr:endopeptidase La [candidate division Zixibacteria bacterium]